MTSGCCDGTPPAEKLGSSIHLLTLCDSFCIGLGSQLGNQIGGTHNIRKVAAAAAAADAALAEARGVTRTPQAAKTAVADASSQLRCSPSR